MTTHHKTFIDNWYGGYKPTFHNFLEFSIRSVEFANVIANVKSIGIDQTQTTAYMNNKGEIYLPAIWYSEKFYRDVMKYSDEQAINAAISYHNGAQIHESLHVKHTPLTFKTEIDRISEKYKKDEQMLMFCLNLIEDIFIEHIGEKTYKNIFPFNRFVNDLFFTDDKTDEIIDKWLSTKDDELGGPNTQALINSLISWKRVENRDKYTDDSYKPFVELFEQACNPDIDFKKRLNLAVQLYDLLVENEVKPNLFANGDLDGLQSVPSELMDKIEKWIKDNGGEIKRIVERFEKIKSELKPTDIHGQVKSSFTDLAKRLKFQFKLDNAGEKIQPDKRWLSFANYIRYTQSPKPDFYVTKDSGSILVDHELYRIGIDGNVLTDKINTAKKKDKPQFLLLVDSSGSMGRMYQDVVRAASGIFLSLSQSDIPVSMFGHSGDNYPVIYGIASYKMPFQNKQLQTTQDAFKRISNAVHIDLQENYDGFAIYSLKDYFLKSPKRFMIVLSDGQPSGDGYRGSAANEHTKKIVDNLRKDGINVYAISLVESVVQANNQIYGKQYNINGSGNLDSELRKLIVNLI
jgi:hypothetical protein